MLKNRMLKVVLFLGVFLLGASGTSALYYAWRNKSPFDFSMNKINEHEGVVPLVILGSGPASLSAALYGARQKIKTIVIAGNKPGGALTETSYIENWPGRPKILGTEVMKDLQEQAVQFGAEIISDAVERVDFSQWPFQIVTESGRTFYALVVIIGTGSTPKTLGIPGEQEYWGKGVTTCAICDAPFHQDKEVVVIGGGDSAIEEAIQLAAYAKKITILVRKDRMRAAAAMQDRLHDYANIEIKYNTEVRSIVGDGDLVTGVELFDSKTDTQSTMQVSGVFLAIGHDPNAALFKQYLKLDAEGTISLADRTQATSLAGIFAAGDVTDHRYRQAGVAAGDGIKAALDAVSFLQEHGFNTTVAREIEKRSKPTIAEKRVEVPQIKQLEELKEIINAAKGLVVVDYYAPYCPSCMRMLPSLSAVAAEFAEQVAFLKVDTSVSPEIAQEYHVPTIPCLMVFKDQKMIARINQPMSRKQLEELMNKLLDQEDA
ncbi:thioredoxin-disulfide reductase [Candidatus Dependentiae bacterium]|nr:thioredoxin-disulfide reductase [Candidatus Dependentiae bacterium]